MLASPGGKTRSGDGNAGMPTSAGWMHEVKWDGVRLIAHIRDGEVVLRSRSGRDVSAGFPELATLGELAGDAVLDGEAIVWRHGLPSFVHVVDRVHIASGKRGAAFAAQAAKERPATFAVFDLLRLDHLDVTGLALRHRRAALEGIWTDEASRFLAHAYDNGPSLLETTREHGLEGVISKRWDSVYQPGVRSRDWLKFPHRATASFVIGGWRPQVGSARLGAVLVGTPSRADPARLHYRGRVGSGLAGSAGEQLAAMLVHAPAVESPFLGEVPHVDVVGTTWVTPRLVIDVAALNMAAVNAALATQFDKPQRLRHPSYQGLRADLTPSEVARA